MKVFKIIICFILITFLLCSCNKNIPFDTETAESAIESTSVTVTTELEETSKGTSVTKSYNNAGTQAETTAKVESIEKVGDMVFTNSADNKFISAISSKYNISCDLLACLYTSTNEDRNYVWQFKDSRDDSGRVIKTADTLQYVYIVSQDCTTIKRTGGFTGNTNISAAEGYIVFQAAKKMQIPQHQQELYS